MREIKLLCWNVNGIRAVVRKGFLDWLGAEAPDILGLQETRAHLGQLPGDLAQPPGYHAHWSAAERPGYSGVAILSRETPVGVEYGLGLPQFDVEGRTIIARYPQFTLLNIYFPKGKEGDARLKYKLDFYEAFLNFANGLRARGERLIVCGDFNTAHKEIDLARPKQNEGVSGFLPEERAWMDRFVASGYVDTFRHFNNEPHHYTWWDMKTRARERNVGWRIDYIFVTGDLLGSVSKAFILHDVMGSDHCPVGICLKVSAG